jgi:hypothetical protein
VLMRLGEAWAKEHSIPTLILKPEYQKYGNIAPLLRNTDIINECTHLLAFPHKSGSGTQDAIRKAMKLDKILIIHHL